MQFYFLSNDEGKLEFIFAFPAINIMANLTKGFEVIDYENRSEDKPEIPSQYIRFTSVFQIKEFLKKVSSENLSLLLPKLTFDVSKVAPGFSAFAEFANPKMVNACLDILDGLMAGKPYLTKDIIADFDQFNQYRNDLFIPFTQANFARKFGSNPFYESTNLLFIDLEQTFNKSEAINHDMVEKINTGAYIFGSLFSYTLGFKWLHDLLLWSTNSHNSQRPRNYGLNWISFFTNRLVIGAQILGELLGAVVTAALYAPLYFKNHLGNRIERSRICRELESALADASDEDKKQMIFYWLQDADNANWLRGERDRSESRLNTETNLMAKYVDAFDFLEAALTEYNQITDTTKPGFSKKELKRINAYIQGRASFDPTDTEQDILENLAKFNQGMSIYSIGKSLLDEANSELAFLFLTHVRPDDQNYQQAMFECCNILIGMNRISDAKYFAIQSQDKELLSLFFNPYKSPDEQFSVAAYGSRVVESESKEQGKSPQEDPPGYKYSELVAVYGLNKQKDIPSPIEEVRASSLNQQCSAGG